MKIHALVLAVFLGFPLAALAQDRDAGVSGSNPPKAVIEDADVHVVVDPEKSDRLVRAKLGLKPLGDSEIAARRALHEGLGNIPPEAAPLVLKATGYGDDHLYGPGAGPAAPPNAGMAGVP